MTEAKKAKRLLKNFNFESEGASVSLVGPIVGGAANGSKTLIMKALKTPDPILAEIEKAKVQVTMDFEDFLCKFFNMYSEQAEVLATLLGMDEPDDATEAEPSWYENYIAEQVASFTIMKALHKSENLEKAVEALDPKDLLLILKDQATLENAFKVQPKEKTTKAPKSKKPKDTMSTDTVEKSQYTAIVKELEDNRVILQKALETLAGYEKTQKDLINKARKGTIDAIVANDEHATILFKSLETLSDETFISVTDVLKSLVTSKELIEKSSLFTEVGGAGDVVAQSNSDASMALVAKALRQQFNLKD